MYMIISYTSLCKINRNVLKDTWRNTTSILFLVDVLGMKKVPFNVIQYNSSQLTIIVNCSTLARKVLMKMQETLPGYIGWY